MWFPVQTARHVGNNPYTWSPGGESPAHLYSIVVEALRAEIKRENLAGAGVNAVVCARTTPLKTLLARRSDARIVFMEEPTS
jgi:hypothetical protein